MKKAVTLLIAIIIIFMNIPVFADGSNLVQNDSFELGSIQNLNGWDKSTWDTNNGVTEFLIDESTFRSGNRSACIINNSVNDSRLRQEIKVKGNSYYKISCWIKTENIGTDMKGANISIDGILDTSKDIRGTNADWEYVELYGKTEKKQDSFVLTVGIGGYGSTNTGKAWFDDVSVEKVNKIPSGISSVKFYREETPNTSNNNPVPKNKDISSMYTYTAAFFIIGLLLFYLIKKDMIKMATGREKLYLPLLLGAGLIIRIIVAPIIEGFSVDIGCFKAWANAAANDLPNFYNTGMFVDYPPFYILILSIIGTIGKAFNMAYNSSSYLLLIKLPSIIADVVTAYLIYRMASKQFKPEFGLLLSALYVFNPAVLLNSTLWGQVDSFFTMMIIIALMLIKAEQKPLATAVFAAAVLMKPQAIIFLPVLGCELVIELFKRKNIKNIVLSTVYGLITTVAILLPFSSGKSPLWIYDLYMKTKDGYTYATLNAFNLFGLLGANLRQDSEIFFVLSYSTWGWIFFFAICCVLTPFLYYKAKNSGVTDVTALVQIVGIFVLWTRMHERYMFPAVALALIAYISLKDIRFLALFGGFTATVFINTQDVLSRMLLTDYPHVPADDTTLLVVSFVNVLLLAVLIWVAVDTVVRNKLYIFDFKFNTRAAAKSQSKQKAAQ
ncbi:MAG: glycosyltransferase family 39 protein [Bacillota bacterium]